MSKLNGVKTVDMANGEITKVSYDGAEYVKVDGVALKGDLGMALANCSDVSLGDFFEIVSIDTDGSAMFNDNGGDLRSWRTKRLSTFRKVNAKPSEPTEQLQVGDAVKVSIPEGQRPAYGWGGVKNGDVGNVISINGGEARVEFTTQNPWNGRLTELVKVAEDGYVRVTDRKPKAGDYVKFSEDGYDVTAGIYYEVTAIDEDGDAEFIDDAGDENSAVVDYETFEVYELVGTKRTETLKVGDYAKVIKSGTHNFPIGTYVKLVGEGHNPKFKAEYLDGHDFWFVGDEHAVKATDEEVAKELAPKFNVGDYAKVTGATYNNDIQFGNLVKIAQELDEDGDYKIRLLDDSDYDYAKPEALEKVSAEEVAKTEAEAKLAEQFAKLGRMPNEFKKGDLVRVIKDSSGHKTGTIGEVTEDRTQSENRRIYTRAVYTDGRTLELYSHVKLIAPVESRVDSQ